MLCVKLKNRMVYPVWKHDHRNSQNRDYIVTTHNFKIDWETRCQIIRWKLWCNRLSLVDLSLPVSVLPPFFYTSVSSLYPSLISRLLLTFPPFSASLWESIPGIPFVTMDDIFRFLWEFLSPSIQQCRLRTTLNTMSIKHGFASVIVIVCVYMRPCMRVCIHAFGSRLCACMIAHKHFPVNCQNRD